MSANAILVASIAVISQVGSHAPSVTSMQREFTQGMSPVSDCRKVENAYHLGNGPIIKRGNKLISRVEGPDQRQITETTTFCVEY